MTVWQDFFAPPTGNGVLGAGVADLLHVRDERTAGTSAGTFTSGAWQTRVLNTVKTNEIDGSSLSSNQITLPIGTYEIIASAPGYKTVSHKTRLRNITASTTIIVGSSETSNLGSDGETQSRSIVCGRFTLSVESVLELQHRCDTTFATLGLGRGVNIDSQIEVFSDVKIRKITAVLTASGLPFSGAVVELSSDKALTTNVPVPWDQEVSDFGDWWEPGSPTELTVPAGVTKVRVKAMISVNAGTVDQQTEIRKNGSRLKGMAYSRVDTSSDVLVHTLSSAVIEVNEGDFFEVNPVFGSGSPSLREHGGTGSWFGIEAVEGVAQLAETFKGALRRRATTSGTFPTGATNNVVWDQTDYDIGGWVFDATEWVVPDGVTRAMMKFMFTTDGGSNTGEIQFHIRQTSPGSGIIAADVRENIETSIPNSGTVVTAIIDVTPGERFKVDFGHNTGSNRTLTGSSTSLNTWFSIEAIPENYGGGVGEITELADVDTSTISPSVGDRLNWDGSDWVPTSTIIDSSSNVLLDFVSDESAVNYVEIENEATGSGPIIRSIGADTNVDLNIEAKGTGAIVFASPLALGPAPLIALDTVIDGGFVIPPIAAGPPSFVDVAFGTAAPTGAAGDSVILGFLGPPPPGLMFNAFIIAPTAIIVRVADVTGAGFAGAALPLKATVMSF